MFVPMWIICLVGFLGIGAVVVGVIAWRALDLLTSFYPFRR